MEDSLSTGRWQPGIDYLYILEWTERLSFSGSPRSSGYSLGEIAFNQTDTDFEDHFIAWSHSLALGTKVSEKATGYFEWFLVFTYGREQTHYQRWGGPLNQPECRYWF